MGPAWNSVQRIGMISWHSLESMCSIVSVSRFVLPSPWTITLSGWCDQLPKAQFSKFQVWGAIFIYMLYIDLDDWQASTGMIMFGQRRTCICKLRSIMGMETSQVQQGTWKRRAQDTSSLCRVFCAVLMVDSPFFPSSRWKNHWRSRCSPDSYRMAKHSVAIVAPGPAGLLIYVGAIVLKDWGWAA